jgi:hypothetical protein
MDNWTIVILPLSGVMIGAAMQFFFSRAVEREKHVGNLRSQAYADYLRAVAAAAHLLTNEDLRNALRDAADAKARISVYGSARVIKALSQFEEAGAVLNNERSVRAFVSVVASMRSIKSKIPVRELELVLLGTAKRDGIADRSKNASTT